MCCNDVVMVLMRWLEECYSILRCGGRLGFSRKISVSALIYCWGSEICSKTSVKLKRWCKNWSWRVDEVSGLFRAGPPRLAWWVLAVFVVGLGYHSTTSIGWRGWLERIISRKIMRQILFSLIREFCFEFSLENHEVILWLIRKSIRSFDSDMRKEISLKQTRNFVNEERY